jgi:hypothetical protein
MFAAHLHSKGLPEFSLYSIPKRKDMPHDHKVHLQNIPNGRKIFQMGAKYSKWA